MRERRLLVPLSGRGNTPVGVIQKQVNLNKQCQVERTANWVVPDIAVQQVAQQQAAAQTAAPELFPGLHIEARPRRYLRSISDHVIGRQPAGYSIHGLVILPGSAGNSGEHCPQPQIRHRSPSQPGREIMPGDFTPLVPGCGSSIDQYPGAICQMELQISRDPTGTCQADADNLRALAGGNAGDGGEMAVGGIKTNFTPLQRQSRGSAIGGSRFPS